MAIQKCTRQMTLRNVDLATGQSGESWLYD